ncbi:MAG: pyrimidine-nucleoside phosphorylase [Clostridia bacterium]|nr:pyrimidine-nucleoside phosphorylase [Clostridia bacterium]
MNMYEIILKKRNGGKLSEEEIKYFIKGYVDGSIPDYQASALLMAIFFNDLDMEELLNLTNEMRFSGDTVDLSKIEGIKVDKHSTGGVGDKTTLIVAPIAAAAGVPIAKMSGRGLGFTGGTVDKMESIPDFKTTLKPDEFLNQVNNIGIAVIGQSGHITPADKKIYALRDVTATVDKMPLIASSIMSKKLAAGSDAIVLDVKCGKGAFMQNIDDATSLADTMVKIGNLAGRKTVAVITDMNQPLGDAIGNSLEVIESIEVLKGNGPKDIKELSLRLSAIMITLGKKAKDYDEGYEIAKEMISSGKALEKLGQFIKAQGGDEKVLYDYSLFPQPKYEKVLTAKEDGYIYEIDAMGIGMASQKLGAGRRTKEEDIDLAAGIMLNYKVGDKVKKGDVLLTCYSSDEAKLAEGLEEAEKAYVYKDAKPEDNELIKKVID